MRAIMIPLALAASLSLPLSAQNPRFIKVDIVSKSFHQHAKCKGADGPSEVRVRLPINLAQSVLDMVGDAEIKLDGESKRGLKPDQLQKLLASAKPGDVLLEVTTDKGDHIRVAIE